VASSKKLLALQALETLVDGVAGITTVKLTDSEENVTRFNVSRSDLPIAWIWPVTETVEYTPGVLSENSFTGFIRVLVLDWDSEMATVDVLEKGIRDAVGEDVRLGGTATVIDITTVRNRIEPYPLLGRDIGFRIRLEASIQDV